MLLTRNDKQTDEAGERQTIRERIDCKDTATTIAIRAQLTRFNASWPPRTSPSWTTASNRP